MLILGKVDEKPSRDFDGHLRPEKQKQVFMGHQGLGIGPGKLLMLKLEPHGAIPYKEIPALKHLSH